LFIELINNFLVRETFARLAPHREGEEGAEVWMDVPKTAISMNGPDSNA
jgi:hypothetical protein